MAHPCSTADGSVLLELITQNCDDSHCVSGTLGGLEVMSPTQQFIL